MVIILRANARGTQCKNCQLEVYKNEFDTFFGRSHEFAPVCDIFLCDCILDKELLPEIISFRDFSFHNFHGMINGQVKRFRQSNLAEKFDGVVIY